MVSNEILESLCLKGGTRGLHLQSKRYLYTHLLVGVKVSSPSVVNTSDSDSESEEMTMALAMIHEEKDPRVVWKLGS